MIVLPIAFIDLTGCPDRVSQEDAIRSAMNNYKRLLLLSHLTLDATPIVLKAVHDQALFLASLLTDQVCQVEVTLCLFDNEMECTQASIAVTTRP